MRVEGRWTRTAHKIAAAVITGTLAVTAAPLTTTSAVAAPARNVKLGPVTGLEATATKPAGTYLVTTTWNPLAAAAAYQVTMTNTATGTVVDQGRVTTNTWNASTSMPATTPLSVKVVPLTDTNRRGRAATTTVVLPDVSAPTGSFKADDDQWDGVITQLAAPTDDVTAPAAIVRQVDWGGDNWVTWTEGEMITSTYAVEGVYHPRVRLTDAAGNARFYELTLVIGDTTAPTGSFSVTPAEGWVGLTRVALSEVDVDDDFSLDEDIERWVIWGDETAPVRWSGDGTLTHVYRTAGTWAPKVRLVDQAGNTVEVETTAVLSKADTVAPTVKVRAPKTRVKYVASWRTVRGTAQDVAGMGVATVRVRAIEKRGAAWFAYRGPSRTWVKAGTKAAAMRKSRLAMVAPTATGAWSSKLVNLRKGTLVLKVQARDRAGNLSKVTTIRKILSR